MSQDRRKSKQDWRRAVDQALKLPATPFRWTPRCVSGTELPSSFVILGFLEAVENEPRLQNVEYFDTDYWEIILYIGQCYELVKLEKYREARRKLQSLLQKMSMLEQKNTEDSAIYHKAFKYIMYAILKNADNEPKLPESPDTSPPISEIESVDVKRAIYEYGALFFKRYGLSGLEKAEDFLSKLIDDETIPKKSWWYFEKAKILARIRELQKEKEIPVPSADEFDLVRKATEITPTHALYKLHLANLHRQNKEIDESQNLYRKFAEEYRDCPDLLCKCADGLLSLLDEPDCDHKCREKLLYEVKSLLDSVVTDIDLQSDMKRRCLAKYYEHKQDIQQAANILRSCVTYTFDATMDLLRLSFSSRAPIILLENLYLLLGEQKEDTSKRIVTNFIRREILSFRLLKQKQVFDALIIASCEYLKNASAEIDPKLVHTPRIGVYMKTRHGLDLIKLLKNECDLKEASESTLGDFQSMFDDFVLLLQSKGVHYHDYEADFSIEKYVSLQPVSPEEKIDNYENDEAGNTYISKKVGEFHINLPPELKNEPILEEPLTSSIKSKSTKKLPSSSVEPLFRSSRVSPAGVVSITTPEGVRDVTLKMKDISSRILSLGEEQRTVKKLRTCTKTKSSDCSPNEGTRDASGLSLPSTSQGEGLPASLASESGVQDETKPPCGLAVPPASNTSSSDES